MSQLLEASSSKTRGTKLAFDVIHKSKAIEKYKELQKNYPELSGAIHSLNALMKLLQDTKGSSNNTLIYNVTENTMMGLQNELKAEALALSLNSSSLTVSAGL